MDELWDLIRAIPRGRVVSYGALGRALEHPISGYLVGRRMAKCPAGLPWWRVVTKDGRVVTGKRDPVIAADQLQRLKRDKTKMADEGTVSPSAFIDPELLLASRPRPPD